MRQLTTQRALEDRLLERGQLLVLVLRLTLKLSQLLTPGSIVHMPHLL